MQLRYLQTLTSIASDKSNTIVFPVSMDLINGPDANAHERPKNPGDFAGPDESGGLDGSDSTDKAMLERSEMEEVTADYANKQA
jgi:hypothetical protein